MLVVKQYLPNIIAFVAILVLGLPLSKILNKALFKILKKSKVDKAISSFISSIFKVLSFFVVVVLAVSKLLGTDLSSLIATFGAVFVAFSIVLKDYISNAVSGTVILANKPFTIGDIIEIGNTTGEVVKMSFLSTKILTPSKKEVTIPNVRLVNENVTGYHKESEVSFSFDCSVKDDEQLKLFLEKFYSLEPSDEKNKIKVLRSTAGEINFKVLSVCSYENYKEKERNIQLSLKSALKIENLKETLISENNKITR